MDEGLGVCRYLIIKVMLVVGLLVTCSGLSAQESILNGLDTQKSLKVLLPHNNKPISYMHEGKAEGIYVDLLEYIANSQGLKLDVELVSFARANQLMLNSRADITIAHSAISTERPGAIYLPFSNELAISVYSLQDNKIEIQQENDLWQYKIGIQRIIPDLQIQGEKVQNFKTPSHQVKALKAGRVELIFLAEGGQPYWEKLYGVQLHRVHRYLTNTIALWFNGATLEGATKEYCQLFAQGFDGLRQAGELSRVASKYSANMVDTIFRPASDDTPYLCENAL